MLLSAQGMDVAAIAKVSFTSADRVRDVIHNFNTDGFDSLRPRYAGGRPPKFDTEARAAITQIALARPSDHGLPFSTWSLSKLADCLAAKGVVEDISHEGLRQLLRDEGVWLSKPLKPGRPAPTLTTRPRRTASWSSTRSPTERRNPSRGIRPW